MSKRLLWALLLIAVSIIILVSNTRGSVSVNLLPGLDLAITGMKALVYLGFLATGVIIGILVK